MPAQVWVEARWGLRELLSPFVDTDVAYMLEGRAGACRPLLLPPAVHTAPGENDGRRTVAFNRLWCREAWSRAAQLGRCGLRERVAMSGDIFRARTWGCHSLHPVGREPGC